MKTLINIIFVCIALVFFQQTNGQMVSFSKALPVWISDHQVRS